MIEGLNSVEEPNVIKFLESIMNSIRVLNTKILGILTGYQRIVYEVLANGATNMEFDSHSSVKVTPTQNDTYTTTVPAAGNIATLLILTSGTSSYTITFGSGFKTTGTLATGVTSARIFVLQFISDGTNLYELSRTVAMVA